MKGGKGTKQERRPESFRGRRKGKGKGENVKGDGGKDRRREKGRGVLGFRSTMTDNM